MKQRYIPGLILCCLLATAPTVSAQDASYSVDRGKTIRIFSWSFFDNLCKMTNIPAIRLVEGGKLGSITSATAPLKIRRVTDSAQSNCIGKTVEGAVINYTAGQTPGTETIRLARKRLKGKDAQYSISVTVK